MLLTVLLLLLEDMGEERGWLECSSYVCAGSGGFGNGIARAL